MQSNLVESFQNTLVGAVSLCLWVMPRKDYQRKWIHFRQVSRAVLSFLSKCTKVFEFLHKNFYGIMCFYIRARGYDQRSWAPAYRRRTRRLFGGTGDHQITLMDLMHRSGDGFQRLPGALGQRQCGRGPCSAGLHRIQRQA